VANVISFILCCCAQTKKKKYTNDTLFFHRIGMMQKLD
jgi:hypothetical protein